MRYIMKYIVLACFLVVSVNQLMACNVNNGIEDQDQFQGFENDLPSNEEIHKTEGKAEIEKSPFKIDDFIGRWNAISDEQMSELYISTFERNDNKDQLIYISTFSNAYMLSVTTTSDRYIEKVSFQGNAVSENERYSLLTGWSQVILMINTDFEYYDVNQIFDKLGIDPNGFIPDGEQLIEYSGLQYRLSHDGNNYLFEVIYP
ncbi:hypothetical protein LGQ02_11200 [Bacillus shivajii]|uniref:hypothetical protein n=1 Tax=Bacillus shivajii TaxID=1983719 RepID=UPI001CFAFA25|nr:hypothetical protein [Bacillus shivajii]UCZ51445.1 hypothetical protein LGQ02_11200 [Bacillus shivajii]